MICPVCNDIEHRLYVRGTISTAMYSAPYWENGVYHSHDGNRSDLSYECSNGHYLSVSSVGGCPAGDYERTSTTRIYFKHDVCGNFGLDAADATECSWCRFLVTDAFRKAVREVKSAYSDLPGWQRRRKTLEKFAQECRDGAVA
jgi:hypothetical protein